MLSHTTKGIVAHPPTDEGRQWELEEIGVPPLGDDQVLVDIVASGVCHTDLNCGSAPHVESELLPLSPYPRVLGHEGSGWVKKVGANVTHVKPGDPVLLSFSFCQNCHNCKYGAPGYCLKWKNRNLRGRTNQFRSNGKDENDISGAFFGQSSFAQLTRADACTVVNVAGLIDNEEDLKMFAPMGCGFQTGAGTITELGAARPVDKVVILGLGGVGLTAIMAAKNIGCQTIIGVDRIPSRIELAKSLGATHGIDTSEKGVDLVETVRKMTDGSGATITVDATGVPFLIKNGLEFTAPQGKMILLGMSPPPPAGVMEISLLDFMTTGKQLMGSAEGAVTPSKYIPRLIQWYKEGKFPIDKLIKFYKVEDFKTAIKDMAADTIKPVLIWEPQSGNKPSQ